MQTILIMLLFLGAVGYMASRAYQTVSRKNAGCGKGCGCSSDGKPAKLIAKPVGADA